MISLFQGIISSYFGLNQINYVCDFLLMVLLVTRLSSEGGGKLRFVLTDKELATINRILDSNFVSIEIVRHKFFSGTWATNILFQNENSFCEYNSGSGEFLVATIVPIGGIEQLLITQFIIKKGEDYQKISELLHMIAEQH